MSELMKEQGFGVEVEFTGITRKHAADIIAQTFGTVAGSPESNCYHTRKISDQMGRKWQLMRDSSIRPETKAVEYASDEFKCEMVTPILNYEDIELLQTVIRNLRAAGAMANSSCGIHVHVDASKQTPASIRRMVNFFVGRQSLIYEALQIGARADRWCHPMSKVLLSSLHLDDESTMYDVERIWYSSANDNYMGGIDHSHYNSTRYHGLNLHSLFTGKGLEFRLFNGTMHAGKIKAYIQFCLAVSAWAITAKDNMKYRGINNYTASQKVTLMKNVLTNRLGLTGREFKTCRLWMTEGLRIEAEAAGQIAA